jgi:hypothetical protein
MSNFNSKSSKQLMIIVAVVLVLYLMTKSTYEEEYYEEEDQSGYKSNAAFNLAPHVYVPPSAAQMAAASPILANANVAALTPAQAAALGKVAPKGVSEYSANAYRDLMATKFIPPTAAQVAAAQSVLANANAAALTPAQAAALGKVAAKGVSEYSTNATVNRKAYAHQFSPPTAAQIASAQTILANANVAALTPAQAAALGKVAPAPATVTSKYGPGYGMASVKF